MTATLDFTRPNAAPTGLSRLFRSRGDRAMADSDPDPARARRAFILDKMTDTGFASPGGVEAMMAHYPRDF